MTVSAFDGGRHQLLMIELAADDKLSDDSESEAVRQRNIPTGAACGASAASGTVVSCSGDASTFNAGFAR
jgi:hypothetical protein